MNADKRGSEQLDSRRVWLRRTTTIKRKGLQVIRGHSCFVLIRVYPRSSAANLCVRDSVAENPGRLEWFRVTSKKRSEDGPHRVRQIQHRARWPPVRDPTRSQQLPYYLH